MQKEQEYPNSLGTQSLIDTIVNWDYRTKHIWDTTLINVATIVRNNIAKDKTDEEIVQNTYTDLRNLNLAIYYYIEGQKESDNPYTVMYVPDYSKIPEVCRRKLSPQEERITVICNKIANSIKNKQDGDTSTLLGLDLYLVKLGTSRELPYKQLVNKIYKINSSNEKITKIMTRRYMLISHIAMDYYIFNTHLRDIKLLECYTGNVRTVKDLGTKLFKDSNIPFNQYTHSLFGDSTRLRPMVTRKKREEFTEIAKRYKWNLKTPVEIKGQISMIDQPLGVLLSQVNY